MKEDILSQRYGRWIRDNGFELAQALDGLLGRHPVVVDVGAYKGDFFSCILTLRPHARVHAFEPIPRRGRKLAKAFSLFKGVTVHPVALGEVDATACLHVSRANTLSSLLLPTADGLRRHGSRLEETEAIEVLVQRLEDYASLEIPQDRPIDLLKLDVQGGELRVLKGAGSLLATTRVIVVEMAEWATYEGQALASELDAYLCELGFVQHGVYVARETSLLRSGEDAIYVNSAL